MKSFKTISEKIFDIIEIHLPSVMFFLLFVFYITMISYRYIFLKQISWLYEICSILFLWCAVLGTSYGIRSGRHVKFTVVYDKMSGKMKLAFRFIGNLFLIIISAIWLPYTLKYIDFLSIKISSVLKIPYSVIFSPIIVLIVLTLIHFSVLFIKDIKEMMAIMKGRGKA